MDIGTLLLGLFGFVLLVVGGEALVRGAAAFASCRGVPPLVVGLTVVAFGTSAPELAVSLVAAVEGRPDISVGNVVGSNILNVLLVLGASAAVAPLVVARQLVRLDVPVMVGVTLLAWALAADGTLGRLEGLLLLAALAGYAVMQVRIGRRGAAIAAEVGGPRGSWAQAGLVLGGLGLLVLGSAWFVAAAAAAARALGLSEAVVGLTIVAAGTSAPEVVTSIVASARGHRDIAAGNVVGSNIFNLLGVLGASAAVAPGGVGVAPSLLGLDFPVMAAAAFACLPVFFTGHRISRWEGWAFLAYYAAYTAYLVLAAGSHDALPRFSSVMIGWVVPLTALTLGVLAWREWRARRDPRP